MFQCCSGVDRNPAVIADVVGFERAEREVPGAFVERIRAKGIGHADEASAVGSKNCCGTRLSIPVSPASAAIWHSHLVNC